MTYFVLAYNRSTGRLLVGPEPHDDHLIALDRRFALEKEHRDHPEVEIVVLGADSEETIRKTHGRYFYGLDELISRMTHAAS